MSIQSVDSFDTMCELDSRTRDGLAVRMLWSERTGAIVSVQDVRTGESFTVDVGPKDSPREVFHHPYAYAAARQAEASASEDRAAAIAT